VLACLLVVKDMRRY